MIRKLHLLSQAKAKSGDQNWYTLKIVNIDMSNVMLEQTVIISIIYSVDGRIKTNLTNMEI